MLTESERIENTRRQIRDAIRDYFAHVPRGEVNPGSFSADFVEELAIQSVRTKSKLRDIFSRSPHWNDEMSMLEVDVELPKEVSKVQLGRLLHNVFTGTWFSPVELPFKWEHTNAFSLGYTHFLEYLTDFFYVHMCEGEQGIDERIVHSSVLEYGLQALAPKAVVPGKKLSRAAQEIAKSAGIVDTRQGCFYQQHFAKLADFFKIRNETKKLYISLNPAHFLTMSNPKDDRRGSMMTSCHSLNCTEYSYNGGCAGYALDDVSFIAFTANPDKPETLNNRKTSRQVFMLSPRLGALMQSRMYNAMGVEGIALTKTYAKAVLEVLSECMEVPNDWEAFDYDYCESNVVFGVDFEPRPEFSGYADWTHYDFAPVLHLLNTPETREKRRLVDGHTSFVYVGDAGLCIECGSIVKRGLYCKECEGSETCACCGEVMRGEELQRARDTHDGLVCDYCFDTYEFCSDCEEYYRQEETVWLVDAEEIVCRDCANLHYYYCPECGEFYAENSDFVSYEAEDGVHYVCHDCYERVKDTLVYCPVEDSEGVASLCNECYVNAGVCERHDRMNNVAV